MIILNVFGQKLFVPKTVVVSGTVNYLEFMLKASGDWKKASHIYFHASKGTNSYITEFTKNVAKMDLSDGNWNIWLHGDKIVDDEVVFRITTGVYQISVDRTGATTGDYLPAIPTTTTEILSGRIDSAIAQFQTYAHNAEIDAATAKDYAQAAKAQAELSATSAANAATSASSAATSASSMQAQVTQVITYADAAEASAEEASQSATAAAASASSATTVANSAKTKANEAMAKATEASEKADNAKAEGGRAYQKALMAYDEAEDLFEVCEGHETRIAALEAGGGSSYDDTAIKARISTIEGKEAGWNAKQDAITDLTAIRTGAALGATAVQPETGKGLFSGNYNDLTNKPDIPTVPTADINSNTAARHTHDNKAVLDGITATKVSSWDAKSNFSGSYNDLTNKPDIPSDEHINSLIDAKIGTLETLSASVLELVGDEVSG